MSLQEGFERVIDGQAQQDVGIGLGLAHRGGSLLLFVTRGKQAPTPDLTPLAGLTRPQMLYIYTVFWKVIKVS